MLTKQTLVCSSLSGGRSLFEDEVSSLRVSIPAWVEFFHRERRQGLLAFVVAVHGVPHPLLSSPSTTTKTAADGSNTTTTTTTAETGDGNLPSPARATLTPAWTCVRTSIELSRSVEAYRECIGHSQRRTGSWQSKAPPRVFQHMGKADQVRGGHEAFRNAFVFQLGGRVPNPLGVLAEPAIHTNLLFFRHPCSFCLFFCRRVSSVKSDSDRSWGICSTVCSVSNGVAPAHFVRCVENAEKIHVRRSTTCTRVL